MTAINSFDRARLNRILLDHVQTLSHVAVRFGARLVDAHRVVDADRQSVKLTTAGGDTPHAHDLVVGCDGANSIVRQKLSSAARIDTSQSFIDTGYLELRIPPASRPGASKWALDNTCLHIWPRHSYMLIALPNLDGSFTSTLFAPFGLFQELQDAGSVLAFFRDNFPDALAVMDEMDLVQCVLGRQPSSLGSVHCDPMHAGSCAILLGDAAHAMLPFYGQGLNCGLEDVRMFVEVLDAALGGAVSALNEKKGAILDTYNARRRDDVRAIQILAQQNYHEMQSRVATRSYRVRKWLDGMLSKTLPSGWWHSLYEMVTFSNRGYATALNLELRQQHIIQGVMVSAGLAAASAAVAAVRTLARR
ncbi:kynurenine 3-monooxygenase [Malassezia sp. CBS 17886]|nr:kynurenine 3-monooxygenase [Malassezia sp. CBS 17886]